MAERARRPSRGGLRRILAAVLSFGVVVGAAPRAFAFAHRVASGDTLASIAEKYYGRIQYERLLVAANFLDVRGGTPIVRGMRLEVPALEHRKVAQGDTWETLAADLLGSPSRADVLSMANGSSPWLTPEEGSEIAVPYNLRVVVGEGEQITQVAYRHLGDMTKAWMLDHYNGLDGRKLARGDVVLVPLTDLPLTQAGRDAMLSALGTTCSEAGGLGKKTQRKIAQEIPALVADVRAGRYVDAVTRGTRFVATGMLTEPQLALVHQKLTEAYVALDAVGLAAASCAEWRKRDPAARLDPALYSPKIVAACEHAEP
jgi:phage tail protein X